MSPEEVEIEILNPEAVSIETEDGGMTIDFRPETEQVEDFGANLSEFMEEDVLSGLCSELVGHYLSDKTSRRDWEESYIKGLNQLGLKVEERTSPWDGACGVTHPILSEAVVRFQSQAIGEIFPPGGPVRTKIVGKMTSAKTKQSHRVENYMNYLVTEVMTEYRPETEKLLFSLPLAGSAFRKIYWDPSMGRPCAMFVPSEDLVVSYGASSLETCERLTHRMRRNRNDVRKMHISRRRHLARQTHHTRRHQGFAGNTSVRVLLQHGVQHGIGNLVGNLVGMAFANRLTGEKMLAGHAPS